MQQWTGIASLISLVALFSVPASEGCSCMPQHPQTAFCYADFVVRAKVMSSKTLYSKWMAPAEAWQPVMEGDELLGTGERRTPSEIRFAVSIGRTFKAKEAYINISNNKTLFTSASSASCGYHLEDDTAYLIMGRVVEGKAWVSLCDTVIKWNDVTRRMRKLLVGTYARNCDCKVRVCFNKACAERQENSTCSWSFVEDKSKCYRTHGACVMREQMRGNLSSCKWDKPSFSACGLAGSGSSSTPARKVTSTATSSPITSASAAPAATTVSINSTSAAPSDEDDDSFVEQR